MSRERALLRQLRTLHSLQEAVGALRSLSAHHFRTARERLPLARAYVSEVAQCLAVLDPAAPPANADGQDRPTVVLVAADLGMCGDYSARLAREASELRSERGVGPLFCLGRRALGHLAQTGVTPDRVYPAPTSVAALPHTLLPLVEEILAKSDPSSREPVVLVAAQFEGAGQFRPVRVPLLPVAPEPGVHPIATCGYCSPEHLREVVVREYLYAALYTALLGALAAEHGKRLVAAEAARSWLEERTGALQRLAASIRRELSTQEVLELVAAAGTAHRESETEEAS